VSAGSRNRRWAPLVPLDQVFDDGPRTGGRRRRGFHDLIVRRFYGSGRLIESLVVVGAVLSLEKARPDGFMVLHQGQHRVGRAHRRAPGWPPLRLSRPLWCW
jgi:hypothetical protein